VNLIAIDPGYGKNSGGCALAMFMRGVLVSAGFERHTAPGFWRGCGADVVVYELPQVRPREDASPGKANTLIQLAAAGAELAGRLAGSSTPVLAVAPVKWKGAVAKPVCHSRLWGGLSDAERACIGSPCEVERHINEAKRKGGLARWKPGTNYYGTWPLHNILDAVGIGIWYLEKKGIRA
jgi:hypothetical protein